MSDGDSPTSASRAIASRNCCVISRSLVDRVWLGLKDLVPSLVANGWLAFDDSLPEEFWRELQAFPGGDHDDALDALEGAVDLARRYSDARKSLRRINGGPARAPRGLAEF